MKAKQFITKRKKFSENTLINPVAPVPVSRDNPYSNPRYQPKKSRTLDPREKEFGEIVKRELEKTKNTGIRRDGRIDFYAEQQVTEVSMSPGSLKTWSKSEAAEKVRVGFEFEMFFPDTRSTDDDDYGENDYDYDERINNISEISEFFSETNSSRLLDQIEQELRDQYLERVDEWVSENISFSDFEQWLRKKYYDEFKSKNSELDSDQLEEKWESWSQEQWDDDWNSEYYEKYHNLVSDDAYENYSERDFMRDRNLPRLSSVEDYYGLEWPQKYGSSGSRSPEDWADQLSRVLGMPVHTGGYHSRRRGEDHANLESDSSLDPNYESDAGLELITPPRPLPEALSILDRVVDFARKNNIYTNSSSGLHMNLSVEGVENVDWVKLVLFLGDRHVLEIFDRAANTYAKSSFDKLIKKIKDRQEQQELDEDEDDKKSRAIYHEPVDVNRALQVMRDGMLQLAVASLQSGSGSHKYQSVHIKTDNDDSSYIEFRGPGGDWLKKQSENTDILSNTLNRLGRAMTIAADPDAERREYARKLYKVITTQNSNLSDAARLFAKYSAGELTGEQLKRQWAEAVLQAERKANSKQGPGFKDYLIRDRKTKETLERFRASGDQDAVNYARNNYPGVDYEIKRVPDDKDTPASEKRRRELARKISKPVWWKVDIPGTDGRHLGWVYSPSSLRAKQDYLDTRTDLYGMADRVEVSLGTPAELSVPEMPEELQNRVFVRPRDVPMRHTWALINDRGNVRVSFPSPNERMAQDRWRSHMAAFPEDPLWLVPLVDAGSNIASALDLNRLSPGELYWKVSWTERRDGREVQDSLNIGAETAREAISRVSRTMEIMRRDVIPGSMRAEQEQAPSWLRNRQTFSSQGEFTGRWLFKNANNGDVLHTISGIGNSQADANRYAREWAQREGVGHIPLEVVPEMQ